MPFPQGSGPALEPKALVPDEVLLGLRIAPFLRSARELLAVHPEIAAFEQIGDGCHFRYDCADGQIAGHGEVCGITDGILLLVSEAEARWPRVITLSSPDVMRIRIGLEGSESTTREGERVVTTEGPMALVVVEPPGQVPAQMVYTGRHSMVILCADREALQQLWTGREHELPALLQDFIAGALKQTATRRLSLKSDLLRCMEDVVDANKKASRVRFSCARAPRDPLPHYQDAADRRELRSSGCLSYHLQGRVARPADPEATLCLSAVTGRPGQGGGCEPIRSVRRFPPGCRPVDGGYIQELRMERALELLSNSSEPITGVAYKVGYSHQSSFTVAVQRRFGMSPANCAAARGRRKVDVARAPGRLPATLAILIVVYA